MLDLTPYLEFSGQLIQLIFMVGVIFLIIASTFILLIALYFNVIIFKREESEAKLIKLREDSANV